MYKECFKCKITKAIDEFYTHKKMPDGHLNKCKECTKKDVTNNYIKNQEYYKEYYRQREKTESRKKLKHEYRKKWRENNREAYRAHNKVSKAIKSGKLIPQCCAVCSEKNVHAHHPNYKEPLMVVWLCPEHHNKLHRLGES